MKLIRLKKQYIIDILEMTKFQKFFFLVLKPLWIAYIMSLIFELIKDKDCPLFVSCFLGLLVFCSALKFALDYCLLSDARFIFEIIEEEKK